jgi:exopolysaccharide production protein ExoZ
MVVSDNSAQPPPTGILSSIQVLRALAAWCVVVHHYCLIFQVAHPGVVRRLFIDHGATGVDVFFVVSGLVMGLSVSDPAMTPRRFAIKRIARIVPAYWVFTFVIAVLIVTLPDVMVNQGYSLELLVKSLLFVPCQNPDGLGRLPIDTVGWTLNLEVVFYLVVGLSLFVPRAQRWLWIAFGVLLVHRGPGPLSAISDLYGDPVLYEFLIGIAAAHLWRSGALSRGPAWAYVGMALVAICILFRSDAPSGVMRVIGSGPAAFVLVCAMLGLERYFVRASWLVHLGDHSYSVYLAHPPILYLGLYAVTEWHWNRPIVATICLSGIALIGAASFHFIERPAGRLVTRGLSSHTHAGIRDRDQLLSRTSGNDTMR